MVRGLCCCIILAKYPRQATARVEFIDILPSYVEIFSYPNRLTLVLR